AALVIGSVLFAFLGSRAGALGAAAAAIITQVVLSVGLVLVNHSGPALLSAAGQRFLRPIFLASVCVLLIHMLLPDDLFSAALSVATFFLVAVASDIELRTAASRLATIVYAKWRYACATP